LLAAALTLGIVACGGTGGTEPPPPTAGTVKLVMQTVGFGPDLDGYTARLDQGTGKPVPRDGAITFTDVAPGAHTVEIEDVASNCTLGLPQPAVTVQVGRESVVQAVVTCRVDLHGRLIVVSEETGHGQLVSMLPDGTDRIALTADSRDYMSPALFPDGSRMVYSKFDGGFVSTHVFDIASATSIELSVPEAGTRIFQTAVSPNGTQIALQVMIAPHPDAQAFRIWIVGADGSNPVALTSGPPSEPSDFAPQWSQDGQWIVFSRNGTLMQIRPDGTGLAPMSCPGAPCMHGAWSPDGQWLAYTGMSDDNGDGVGENYDIYIMRADGSGATRLTTSPDQEDSPVWSPDGTMLAYNHVINNRIQVFRMMADGSGQVNLTNAPHHESTPVWGPAP
jgi:Tol biopolymer transport system component